MALDGIVMSERHADGRRFVSSYSGVRRGASGGVELERYVTFDAADAHLDARSRASVYRRGPALGNAHTRGGGRMEIAVPLVVGGLAGLSVATACGAEPRVPRVPPAELARQTLESVAEKLPRELVENDLLKKIARSWASLAPAASPWPCHRGCRGASGISAAVERCLQRFTDRWCRCRPSALSWDWLRRLPRGRRS